ncbi:MAG: hypothetical protein RL095_976 [Verrucomicrobiota bacterium]|jgi:hypothetical protein
MKTPEDIDMKKTVALGLAAGLGVAACAVWWTSRSGDAKIEADPVPAKNAPGSYTPATLRPGFEALAVDPLDPWKGGGSPQAKKPEDDYGRTPETPADVLDNPQAKSNLEALSHPAQFPHRLSPMISESAAFDLQRWERDPEYKKFYLSECVPSRALGGNPDPKVPALRRVSEIAPVVEQGGKIELKVHTAPGAPVTFHSPALNRLESGLTTCTVVADASGEATCTMSGVSGTIGSTFVSAASPCSSSCVVFRVETIASRVPAAK